MRVFLISLLMIFFLSSCLKKAAEGEFDKIAPSALDSVEDAAEGYQSTSTSVTY